MKTTVLPTRNWLEPYPRTFIIPMTMVAEMRLELRELTVGAFLVAVARNAAWRVLYRIRELAWRIGFLDFDEARCGEEGYHGDWKWRWWAPRISAKRIGRLPDDFESAVERSMGERLRAECKAYGVKGLGSRLYGSITNQDWRHVNGDSAGYSFRAAGDLIAAIIGDGDYMDWYCSSPEGVVDEEVMELLAKEGWSPERPRGLLIYQTIPALERQPVQMIELPSTATEWKHEEDA